MSATDDLQTDLTAAASHAAHPVDEAAPPGEISARISAILDSAEEEAEKIRESARAEAATIIRSAHASAAERIDELTREPERIRNEAEEKARQLLDTTRADVAEQVAEAERQAATLTREAEQHAVDTRRAAERAASDMEAEMERRRRALQDELEALSHLREQAGGSVQEVVQVLQRTASDIDRRLGSIPSSEAERKQAAPDAQASKAGLRLLRRGNED